MEQQRPPPNRVSAKVERALRVLRLKTEGNANAVVNKSKRSLDALQHLHHAGLFLEGVEYGLRVILFDSNLSITITPCPNIQAAEYFTVPQQRIPRFRKQRLGHRFLSTHVQHSADQLYITTTHTAPVEGIGTPISDTLDDFLPKGLESRIIRFCTPDDHADATHCSAEGNNGTIRSAQSSSTLPLTLTLGMSENATYPNDGAQGNVQSVEEAPLLHF